MRPLRAVINLIYPPFCEICDGKLAEEERHICRKCFGKIKINMPPFCRRCSRHLGYDRIYCSECMGRHSYLKRIWSWGVYDDTLKKCIHLFKYRRKPYLINLFKKPLFKFCDENSVTENADIIIPVPLHLAKLDERTFNQAQILAKALSNHYKIQLSDVLKKIKITEPQNKLNKKQRKINVKDAFNVENAKNIYEKKILLVDDVFTTGSTINECAKVLLKAGAKVVYGFTLARGL